MSTACFRCRRSQVTPVTRFPAANFVTEPCALLQKPAFIPAFAIIVLLLHCGLLAWSASRHSPVADEVGHLPAGLSHWRLNRFDLYNVNPPLVRTVATLPLHIMEVPIDFSGYQTQSLNRSEFGIGVRWISAQPETFLRDFAIARFACIPFSLLGAVVCFLWARELYGSVGGLVALCLWCFSPAILAHGSLITPDTGAAAIGVSGCYVFRKWLQHRTIGWAFVSGVFLGLTLLTKFTWLFLVGLWPAFWLVRRFVPAAVGQTCDDAADARRVICPTSRWRQDVGQLILMNLVALWVLNNGYLMEDTCQPLGEYKFFSETLTGREPGGVVGGDGANRFHGTWLENIRVPVPRNFLQGIDHIKFEYERGYLSYLRGVTQHGGWWYYYLYAMLIKMPVGTMALIALAAIIFVCARPFSISRDCFDTVYLLAPAVCVLWLVSSQTGFNHHLRYVLPAFPFLFIFAGRTAWLLCSASRLLRMIPVGCVCWVIVSSLSVYPHSLSYFNELVGGPVNGWKHLDQSNLDWGQDMILVKEWVQRNSEVAPLYIQPSGFLTPQQMGIAVSDLDWNIARDGLSSSGRKFRPGWYIMGLTRLVDPDHPCHELLQREPDDYIGFSMRVYHIEADTEGSVMAE